MAESDNGLRRVRAVVLFFNVPFILFFSLGAALSLTEMLEKVREILFLVTLVYVLNVIIALRGYASQENPFGVLYQIGRIYAGLGNSLVLLLILFSGAFLSFPIGIGLTLASATGLWALFYTDRKAVSPEVPAVPVETPFDGKDDSLRDALTAEHKGLQRRKKWTTGAAEIFGYCALVCGLFIFMSLDRGLDSELFVGLLVFGIFFFMVWLYMRKARNKAAVKKERFYEEYPKARPALRYMHRVQERRLVRLLPDVEKSLRQNILGISYTPPAQVVVSPLRGIMMMLGIIFFVFSYLVSGLFIIYASEAFLPSDSAVIAGGVFTLLMGILLLWRWKYYKKIGYLPPELRKVPRSMHSFEKAALFIAAIGISYMVSVHGVMRMLHEQSRQVTVLENTRVGDAFISGRSGLCMRVPEFSERRSVLCVSRKAEAAFGTRRWRSVQLKVKTSAFGMTVKGATLGGVYYPSTYR